MPSNTDSASKLFGSVDVNNVPAGGGLTVIPNTGLDTPGAGGAGLSIPVPFAQRIVLLEDAHIAGTTHVEGIDVLAEGIEIGQELELKRDVNNLQDTWAIRVIAQDQRVGYIPADCNEMLARLMDSGKKLGAKVTEKELLGSWHKIHMEVYLDD